MTASASAALSVIDGLVTQLTIAHRAIKMNIDGVSHDESLLHPQPAGNSVNWVLGHIVTARSRMLTFRGEPGVIDNAAMEQYRRGSDGNVPNPLPLADLIAALDRAQSAFIAALKRITDAELAAKSPFPSPAGPDASLAEALAGMVFHEAYHVGQLGLLRRLAGKGGAI